MVASNKEWEMAGFAKDFWQATKFLLILTVVTITIQVLLDQKLNWFNVEKWILSNTFFGYPFYFANAYLNDGLNKLFAWEKEPKKRALIGIPAFLVMNTILMIILIYYFQVLILGVEDPEVFDRRHTGTLLISLTICLVATLYFHAAGFFKGMIRQMRLNEKLKEEKISVELNALKSQVNPHFLFNSFNVLSGLIDEDPSKAQKFLGGLSKIYRYILEQRNEDLITLRKELEFAQQYLKLQKTRFEDSVHVDINVPESDLDKKVPSLSLQLLLENAIKHNAFDEKEPLQIEILKSDKGLEVSNNVKKRNHINGSNGIGLENIGKRYDLHNIDGFRYGIEEERFNVVLPLI